MLDKISTKHISHIHRKIDRIFPTWWLIPLSKWVITTVINGISRVNPLITGVITHLLSGMSHQVWYTVLLLIFVASASPIPSCHSIPLQLLQKLARDVAMKALHVGSLQGTTQVDTQDDVTSSHGIFMEYSWIITIFHIMEYCWTIHCILAGTLW